MKVNMKYIVKMMIIQVIFLKKCHLNLKNLKKEIFLNFSNFELL